MITEDYVSFETAKLLKERGFDDMCHVFYDKDGIFINLLQFVGNSNFKGVNAEKITFAPTLQMVMKWLREVHNIHIIARPYTDMKGNNWSFIFNKYAYDCWQELGIYITDSWNSYEETCEAAIKYCLENLLTNKNE